VKRVLLISYYYPPLGDVGGLRALGFSKYLSHFGWKPYVLTVANPDKSYCSIADNKAPYGIDVFRSYSIINLTRVIGKLNGFLALILKKFRKESRTNIFADLLCLPDIFIGWIPLTYLKALKIIRKHDIDEIYVSCMPFSSSIIALLLKRKTQKPIILDLRDPITGHGTDTFSGRFHESVNKSIEKYTLKYFDRVLFVTKETRENYLKTYPWLNTKSNCIYNGFFGEYLPKRSISLYDKFTITYVGNYYAETDDSDLIFEALRNIVLENSISFGNIRFLYIGAQCGWIRRTAEKFELCDIVESLEQVSREESIEVLFKSPVIYIRILRDMISTKLFEGLATGRPLLAATSNEEVKEMIKRYSPHSALTEPHDAGALAEAILNLYSQWNTNRLDGRPNQEYMRKFDKSSLTKEFADVLNTLA
jgi:glycosyltransferase involved in cell wall biosynthesis